MSRRRGAAHLDVMPTMTKDDDLFDLLYPEPEFPDCYAASHPKTPTSAYGRARDRRAANSAADGYVSSTVHLARAYDHAIGWALQYQIPVFTTSPDGSTRLLGLQALRDEIAKHEESTGVVAEFRSAWNALRYRREALRRREVNLRVLSSG